MKQVRSEVGRVSGPAAGTLGRLSAGLAALGGFWAQYRKSTQGLIGLVLLSFFVALAVLAPVLAPYDPLKDVQLAEQMAAPAWLTILPRYRDAPVSTHRSWVPHEWEIGAQAGALVEEAEWRGGPAARIVPVDGQAGATRRLELFWLMPYESQPPSTFSFRFRYGIEAAPEVTSRLRFEIRTPSGRVLDMWSASHRGERRATLVTVDSRDLRVKARVGASPFTDLAREVFSEKGVYRLSLWVEQEVPEGLGEAAEGAATVYLSEFATGVLGKLHGVLGADHLGSDLWSQLVYGARISLVIGIVTALIAVAIGTAVGMISGYIGGAVDEALMRFADVMLSIPTLPILIILAGFMGKGIQNIVILVAVFSWMGTARIVRSQTLSLKERAFVEAARASGARQGYVMLIHILPNVLPLVFASLVLLIPGAILYEAALSFLGLGDPRVATWGRMLQNARSFGAFPALAWWWVLPPGFAITFLSLSFVFIGNTIDSILNPRLRERT